MAFPDKEAREKCWKIRDDYWACLDKYAPDYQYEYSYQYPAIRHFDSEHIIQPGFQHLPLRVIFAWIIDS
uniref:Uncharacterized protein n=1 Tax=Anopheles atroparvus TaxID=41427 RepID=A0AAG5CR73_ANOAO